jgi:hypothetical protein
MDVAIRAAPEPDRDLIAHSPPAAPLAQASAGPESAARPAPPHRPVISGEVETS